MAGGGRDEPLEGPGTIPAGRVRVRASAAGLACHRAETRSGEGSTQCGGGPGAPGVLNPAWPLNTAKSFPLSPRRGQTCPHAPPGSLRLDKGVWRLLPSPPQTPTAPEPTSDASLRLSQRPEGS